MKEYFVDSRSGGLGDVLMRLGGLATATSLLPSVHIHVVVKPSLHRLAKIGFGSFLVVEEEATARHISFTSRGLRHLLPAVVRGHRFLAPYHATKLKFRRRRRFVVDTLNNAAFRLLDRFGLVFVPPVDALRYYQGYFEALMIPEFRRLEWDVFAERLRSVARSVQASLRAAVQPDSDGAKGVAVFPSGTAHQHMPVWWAKQHLPEATYWFFEQDPTRRDYEGAGLQTRCFGANALEVLEAMASSRWTVSTDSFPSHAAQWFTDRATLCMAELPPIHIVRPGFDGVVVESAAPCCPCLHLEKIGHPLCEAGHTDCLTWSSADYSLAIVRSIPT